MICSDVFYNNVSFRKTSLITGLRLYCQDDEIERMRKKEINREREREKKNRRLLVVDHRVKRITNTNDRRTRLLGATYNNG
jgi:hypothetical protein